MSQLFGPPPGQTPAPTTPATTTQTNAGPSVSSQPPQQGPEPQPGQPQQPQLPEFQPLGIPEQQLIDPFYQTQLGQMLRGMSSGYDRSPYGPGQSVGQYVPGSPMYAMQGGQQGQQGQQQQQGGGELAQIMQGLQGLFGGGQPQAQMLQGQTPGQYLGPVGPTEWGHRAGQTNQVMNQMPGMGRTFNTGGPYGTNPQALYRHQLGQQGRFGSGQNRSVPGMQPERWDPYGGIYWWD